MYVTPEYGRWFQITVFENTMWNDTSYSTTSLIISNTNDNSIRQVTVVETYKKVKNL